MVCLCVSSIFAKIVSIGWREQINVQVRIHPLGREMISLGVPVAYVTFSFFCLADRVFCNPFCRVRTV